MLHRCIHRTVSQHGCHLLIGWRETTFFLMKSAYPAPAAGIELTSSCRHLLTSFPPADEPARKRLTTCLKFIAYLIAGPFGLVENSNSTPAARKENGACRTCFSSFGINPGGQFKTNTPAEPKQYGLHLPYHTSLVAALIKHSAHPYHA